MVERTHNRSGFISLFVIVVIMALIAIVSYLHNKSSAFNAMCDRVLKTTQAKNLALSGVDIGIAILAGPPEDTQEEKKGTEQKQQPQDPTKQLLAHILPALNRWQSFRLTEAIDGIDGTIAVCICCEDGKINLNTLYDFEKHEFAPLGTGSWEDLLAILFKQKAIGTKGSFDAFKAFLKKRAGPLEDPSELLVLPEFFSFRERQFYEPPEAGQDISERPFYLFDLFTTVTDTALLNPWVLSDSVSALIGAERAAAGQIDKRKKSMRQWLQGFSADTDWATQWDSQLKPLYKKEFSALPKGFAEALCSRCDIHLFSIIVRAECEGVIQRVVAIVDRRLVEQADEGHSASNRSDSGKTGDQAKQKRAGVRLMIQKLYWL